MEAKAERIARKQGNILLTHLTKDYTVGLPIDSMNNALTAVGFSALEQGIYCGRDGLLHEQVGPRTWFTMTWHRMEVSGRFEVVAYLS